VDNTCWTCAFAWSRLVVEPGLPPYGKVVSRTPVALHLSQAKLAPDLRETDCAKV